MYSLITKARKLCLPVDITLELFDQLVAPILLYGCEIWGFSDLIQIERFYLSFCKQLMKVRSSTPNCMIYGELGKISIRKVIENRMINFWCKIITGKNSKISNIIYRLLKSLYDKEVYKSPWLSKIKEILDNAGLSYLWQSNTINPYWLKRTINQNLSDSFKQNWNEETQSSSQCLNYRIFKKSFKLEKYLTLLDSNDRITLCKFRCGNHKLPIMTGRYQDIERQDRLCNLCLNQQLGDEYHYLFECTSVEAERKLYLKPYYRIRHNTLKMEQLFNSENSKELSNLAKFCRCIVKKFE